MTGMDNIIEMIKSKTEEQEKTIIAEAERYQREKIAEAEDRTKEKADAIVEKAERESKAAISRHEASLKLRTKHKILDAKEKIFNEIMEATVGEVGKVVKGKSYADIVKRLAIDGGVSLDVPSLELIFPGGIKADVTAAPIAKAIGAATGQKTTVSISKETIRATGGVLVRTTDGDKWVNNTFDARLERLESQIRDRVSSLLLQ